MGGWTTHPDSWRCEWNGSRFVSYTVANNPNHPDSYRIEHIAGRRFAVYGSGRHVDLGGREYDDDA